jgi:C-terminal processing protease CtpA/Prc
MPDVPLFILTSHHTFSAAEAFAYHLQALKRATIVGEVTGGGANPAEFLTLAHGFTVAIPNGRSINPITKTSWEGVGVKPDVEVPADRALEEALSAISRLPSRGGALPRGSAPSTSHN